MKICLWLVVWSPRASMPQTCLVRVEAKVMFLKHRETPSNKCSKSKASTGHSSAILQSHFTVSCSFHAALLQAIFRTTKLQMALNFFWIVYDERIQKLLLTARWSTKLTCWNQWKPAQMADTRGKGSVTKILMVGKFPSCRRIHPVRFITVVQGASCTPCVRTCFVRWATNKMLFQMCNSEAEIGSHPI